MSEATRVWTRESVLDLLENNDRAVVSALKVLYSRQTTDEQQIGATKESNGRGFNARDAAVLTDIAQKLPRYNDRMTHRQILLVRGRLRKYVGQLLEEIELKGGMVDKRVQSKPKLQQSVTDDESVAPIETPAPAVEPRPFGAWA